MPPPLGDRVLGKDDAPVTIVEYASMTCPHCAHFHETTYPELKKRYIDTGKVRFIFREFPLDPLAAGASMLARCADKDKFYPLIETLFQQQTKWAVEKPIPQLMAIAKQAGMSEQTFNACLSDQKMLDAMQAEQKRATESSASIPRRRCSSTARSTSAACRSRTWPRPSTRFLPKT